MGFVTLGIFVFNEQGMQGAILQMVNHGLITGALFLLVGVIYERTHDRTIAKMGGVAGPMPVYAVAFGFFVFASAGLPGLSGFVGEFLPSSVRSCISPGVAAVATFCMILAAAYLLWMYQRVAFGELSDFLKGLGHHLDRHDPDGDPDPRSARRARRRLRHLPGPPPRPHRGLGRERPRSTSPQAADRRRSRGGRDPAILIPIVYVVIRMIYLGYAGTREPLDAGGTAR